MDALQIGVVGMKVESQLPEMLQRYAKRNCQGKMLSDGRFLLQDEVQPFVPLLVELDASDDFGGGVKTGRQTGFQWPLVEQLSSEGMEGSDCGLVQVGNALAAMFTLLDRTGFINGHLFQPLAHPVPQFGGGGFGEGDGGDAIQGGPARRNQVYHSLDQAGSLTRAGTGFDKESLVQLVADVLAYRLICGRESVARGSGG